LHGLYREADWITSQYHGRVYGHKAHVSISVAPTIVRVILDASVTGSTCESHVLQARVKDLLPLLRTLLLNAAYDDDDLIAACAQCGIEVLALLSKPIGKSTPQDQGDQAAAQLLQGKWIFQFLDEDLRGGRDWGNSKHIVEEHLRPAISTILIGVFT